MKSLTIGIVALVAAGLAYGAGEQEGAGSSTIDMDMWLSVDVSPDQLWGGPGREFIATVEENYPQIDLTFTTVGERDLVPQFIAAYGAGDPPDIVQQYSSGTTKMVNGGYFRAVDDLFATYEGKDNFREGTLDAYTYDGKLYGIPAIGGHHYIFYYRKDWYSDAGIPNPKTWEDVIRAGQVMTGNNRWAYGHAGGPGYDQGPAYFQLMLLSAGGEVVGADGKAAFNSDIGVQVAEFQRDWIGKYGISPETIAAADDAEIEAGFRAGVYGSYIDGIWEYKQMAQQAADMFPHVGVAPIPKTIASGKHVTYNDNWALFMPANIADEKIATAFELMTLWINVTDAPYGKLGGFLPILKSVAPDFEDPEVKRIMLEEIAPTAVPLPRLENLPEMNDLLASALGKVLLGDETAQAALDAAADRYDSLFAN